MMSNGTLAERLVYSEINLMEMIDNSVFTARISSPFESTRKTLKE